MTRGSVTPIGREPVSRSNDGGFLGLRWRYEPGRDGGCPHLIGFYPDSPGVVIARLKIEILPGGQATASEMAVGAQIWSDYEDGAAALMADAIEREGNTDV